MLRFVLFIFLCTTYSYYCTCTTHFAFTPRGRAILRIPRRIIHIFVARPRPLLSRFIPMCSLSDSRRIYVALRLYQPVRRSAFALNRISLLSDQTLHYFPSRRASRARLYPCAAAVFVCCCFFLLHFLASIIRQPRSKSCLFCCSLIAERNRSHRSHRVDSPPRL